MACPRFDYHIHTHYLGCANATMTVKDTVRVCRVLGCTSIAFTDHLNRPDQAPQHDNIRADIEALENPGLEIFFGVELNFTGQDQSFILTEELISRHGFQFAIGGIHSTYLEEHDLKKIVDIQHRHHLRTCRDPLVQVLVHPYWFSNWEFDSKKFPWFETMQTVPESYTRELGQTAAETGTAIEINSDAIFTNDRYSDAFKNEYSDFLAVLAEEGALLTVGSDAHDIKRLATIEAAWKAVDHLGVTPDRIWRPEITALRT